MRVFSTRSVLIPFSRSSLIGALRGVVAEKHPGTSVRRIADESTPRGRLHAPVGAHRRSSLSRPRIRRLVYALSPRGRVAVHPDDLTPVADRIVEGVGALQDDSQIAQVAPLQVGISERALRRRVWNLALPAIGEQVLAMGVGVSDTFLAGHLTSEASARLGYDRATAVAAVGVASMATWVTITVFLAVNVGVTALVARATGARDGRLASKAAAQGVLLGFLIGLAMVGLAVPLADVIIGLLGVTGEVGVLAAQFVRIVSLGLPFIGAASAATAAMRGAGDARRPLVVMLIVNGINVAASWMLLNGLPSLGIPAIGVVGSACGAAAGWTFGALLALAYLRRTHSTAPRITWPLLRPDREVIARIVRVGLPSAMEIGVFQVGVLTFGRMVVGLGSTSYAAYTAINTVESLGTLPGFGFAVAATALVGQALGARAPRLAVRMVWASLKPCFAVMATIGMLELLFPHILLGLFVADPGVMRAGELAMRISIFTQTASALAFVFNGALRGAGDTKFPVIVRAAGTWGLRVPLALLLIPLWALPGARLAMGLDFWAQAGLAYWRFRGGKWSRIGV